MKDSYQVSPQPEPLSGQAEIQSILTPTTTKANPIGIALALLALYLIWGSTYLGIRIAIESIPPLLMMGIRFIVAGGILYLFLRMRGVPNPSRSQWLGSTAVGILLIGGGMANTFFVAIGCPVGESLLEKDKVSVARELIRQASERKVQLMLPKDVVVASAFSNDAETKTVPCQETPAGWRILDVGPGTVQQYCEIVVGAKTVLWNGPMGVFEMPPFDKGTVALAKAVAESGAISVVGGGDSEKAIKSAGVTNKITHVSTGGGASLEFLAGLELPGVAVLNDKSTA